jgi:acyl carrier protein
VSASFDEICQWLVAKIAKELNVPESQIKTNEEFANLGLGSRQAILITGELEEFLECEDLDPSLLWDYPTIERLARHLSA